MSTRSRPDAIPHTKTIAAWLLDLATRLVARSLQMPEPLVHTTGAYVFAQVQAAETRAVKTLCPLRLLRHLRALLR